jgi:ferredoxin-like protein FixX
MSKPLTREEFIKRAVGTHGRVYDYSNTIYTNAKTKVKILCKLHGEFAQIPYWHMHSQGCPSCGGTKKKTTSDFIKSAIKVHGDKYDYSAVLYVGNKFDVTIVCPVHGKFEQSPDNHLAGKGCLHCGQARVRTHKYKDVKVRGKLFRLQGYEPAALKYIMANKGVRAKDIEAGKRVPVITYKHGKRKRTHYPDFWIPAQNRLIEVKSPWTLGLIGAYTDKHYFEECKAKRTAALAAGYKYTLLLFNGLGERIHLPLNWHCKTKAAVKKFISQTATCKLR